MGILGLWRGVRALKKAGAAGEEAARPMADMLTLYVHDAIDQVAIWGRNILSASVAGDELRAYLAGLRRLVKHDPVNRTELHDVIAERIVAAEGYTTE